MLATKLNQEDCDILSSKKEKMSDHLYQISEDLFNKEILPIIEKHTTPSPLKADSKNVLWTQPTVKAHCHGTGAFKKEVSKV
ncbi:MAG: hypothetical protein MTP17_04145 [Candidatus Midichloria sp.]|nr:MAG: hypothetical protein MTP17_04145 [Candidatus Midichloria sp.]